MFLAEDRILCLEIFCRKARNFTLKYIPDAFAYTDPVFNNKTKIKIYNNFFIHFQR